MDRKVYIEKGNIKILYPENTDRRFIYDMAFEEDAIWQSMFNDKSEFDWAEFRDSEDCVFDSSPSTEKWLLIQYDGEIAGTIAYTYNDGKIKNCELDMWLRSERYTGKGIGSAVMKMLIDQLVRQFGVNTFIIRPWVNNPRAIRAYEKCGFRLKEDFVPSDYYGKYLEQYGDGDYGEDGTYNMVLEL
ncbi:MAG: GNAT family N-acetyltransferase [Oscillospiraceae bacterium]|nr:GNAT family N-acetyltransferase [Oscillospiraceae bacterium]